MQLSSAEQDDIASAPSPHLMWGKRVLLLRQIQVKADNTPFTFRCADPNFPSTQTFSSPYVGWTSVPGPGFSARQSGDRAGQSSHLPPHKRDGRAKSDFPQVFGIGFVAVGYSCVSTRRPVPALSSSTLKAHLEMTHPEACLSTSYTLRNKKATY